MPLFHMEKWQLFQFFKELKQQVYLPTEKKNYYMTYNGEVFESKQFWDQAIFNLLQIRIDSIQLNMQVYLDYHIDIKSLVEYNNGTIQILEMSSLAKQQLSRDLHFQESRKLLFQNECLFSVHRPHFLINWVVISNGYCPLWTGMNISPYFIKSVFLRSFGSEAMSFSMAYVQCPRIACLGT